MRKLKIASFLCAVVFGLMMAGIAFAGEGPETIDLHAGKKGDVTFHHWKHQDKAACGECHHGPGHSEYKQGMEIKQCSECHNKDMKNTKLNKPMKAFHKDCKECHKAKGGPTKCGECHKKK